MLLLLYTSSTAPVHQIPPTTEDSWIISILYKICGADGMPYSRNRTFTYLPACMSK
ncbi:unnamed protein product [Periconia digitata]|uniref:Uncharacterized protein n=1 Tax=Periconia digitata TaxID=1303443 RepID=A0A9W4XIN2_9PLEO|nr:unnamed protein product [Periconia digitata]